MSGAPFSQGWVGTQMPTTSVDELSAQIFAIDSVLNTISTATLVQIQSVTNSPGSVAAIGTVAVLPLVNQLNGLGQPTPHGTVSQLLYFRYQGGKNAVIIDPEVGDIGLAVFADRDISNVKATGAQANPGSRRRFHYSDGIYFGSVIAPAPQQSIAFTDSKITITDANGNVVTMASGGITIQVASGSQVKITGGGGSDLQPVKKADGTNSTFLYCE